MLPGDVGLVAQMNVVRHAILWGVLFVLIVRLVFYYGGGFVPLLSGGSATTPLPAMLFLAPAAVTLITVMIVSATYDRQFFFVTGIFLLLSTITSAIWYLWPVISFVIECVGGVVVCSFGTGVLYFGDLILAIVLVGALFVAFWSFLGFASGYAQAQAARALAARSYGVVTQQEEFDPVFDPLAEEDLTTVPAGGQRKTLAPEADGLVYEDDDSNDEETPAGVIQSQSKLTQRPGRKRPTDKRS
jgi:ABC-type multidrug transport system fused ATPase/permease subunit